MKHKYRIENMFILYILIIICIGTIHQIYRHTLTKSDSNNVSITTTLNTSKKREESLKISEQDKDRLKASLQKLKNTKQSSRPDRVNTTDVDWRTEVDWTAQDDTDPRFLEIISSSKGDNSANDIEDIKNEKKDVNISQDNIASRNDIVSVNEDNEHGENTILFPSSRDGSEEPKVDATITPSSYDGTYPYEETLHYGYELAKCLRDAGYRIYGYERADNTISTPLKKQRQAFSQLFMIPIINCTSEQNKQACKNVGVSREDGTYLAREDGSGGILYGKQDLETLANHSGCTEKTMSDRGTRNYHGADDGTCKGYTRKRVSAIVEGREVTEISVGYACPHGPVFGLPCNHLQSRTPLSESHPILCVKPTLTLRGDLRNSGSYRTAREIQITDPIRGYDIVSREYADTVCKRSFGEEYSMAEQSIYHMPFNKVRINFDYSLFDGPAWVDSFAGSDPRHCENKE